MCACVCILSLNGRLSHWMCNLKRNLTINKMFNKSEISEYLLFSIKKLLYAINVFHYFSYVYLLHY